MAQVKAKSTGPTSPTATALSIESQLREEIKQLTTALDETDQALDEWVQECDRLQKILKANDSHAKHMADQLEELRQHALKLEEERNELRAGLASGKQSVSSPIPPAGKLDNKQIEELRRANEALREQLAQSQEWVKQGLSKLEEAKAETEVQRKRADLIEKEKNAMLKGQKATIESERDKAVWEASRLGAVVHAHELELTLLRSNLSTAKEDLREAEALAGKNQALCAVARFQAECARTDNDIFVDWLKRIVSWSSKL